LNPRSPQKATVRRPFSQAHAVEARLILS